MAILAYSPRRITQASVLNGIFIALTLTIQEVDPLVFVQDLRVKFQTPTRALQVS